MDQDGKTFWRSNAYFSLCGLNCGLCTMRIGGHCPGCGCGPHHSCAVAKCSLAHDGVEYCFLCDEFPCDKYEGVDEYDSFVTHRHQFRDMQKAERMGIEAYTREQMEKVDILRHLLEHYNAGRQKSLYCTAVNLLDIGEVRGIMKELAAEAAELPLKDRAACAAGLFQAAADRQGIGLKLRKKPKAEKPPEAPAKGKERK